MIALVWGSPDPKLCILPSPPVAEVVACWKWFLFLILPL